MSDTCICSVLWKWSFLICLLEELSDTFNVDIITFNADITTGKNVRVTTVGTVEGPLSDRLSIELIQSWLIGSLVSSGINIVLLILFIVMKYRRQNARYCNGLKCFSDIQIQSHSVETHIAMTLICNRLVYLCFCSSKTRIRFFFVLINLSLSASLRYTYTTLPFNMHK